MGDRVIDIVGAKGRDDGSFPLLRVRIYNGSPHCVNWCVSHGQPSHQYAQSEAIFMLIIFCINKICDRKPCVSAAAIFPVPENSKIRCTVIRLPFAVAPNSKMKCNA